MLAGSVISLVEVWTRVEVPAVVTVYGYDVVIVAAGKIEVVVSWRTAVSVSLGNVTGYELNKVSVMEKIDVPVAVACGRVDVIYSVLAARMEVRVRYSVLAGKLVVR